MNKISKEEALKIATEIISFINNKVAGYDFCDHHYADHFILDIVAWLTDPKKDIRDAEYRIGGKYGMGSKIYNYCHPEEVYFAQYPENATPKSKKELEQLTKEIKELYKKLLMEINNDHSIY